MPLIGYTRDHDLWTCAPWEGCGDRGCDCKCHQRRIREVYLPAPPALPASAAGCFRCTIRISPEFAPGGICWNDPSCKRLYCAECLPIHVCPGQIALSWPVPQPPDDDYRDDYERRFGLPHVLGVDDGARAKLSKAPAAPLPELARAGEHASEDCWVCRDGDAGCSAAT